MAEYIEREAAIAFMDEVEPCICRNPAGEVFTATKDKDMLEFLHAIPAADVVPVVRCRECIFGNMPCARARYPDCFCADGKRKDGGKDE